MAGTRSSARQAAAAANSSFSSSQKPPAANNASAGSKRKGSTTTNSKSKRGKKGDEKEQATIEETMPIESKEDDPKDVEMKDDVESAKPDVEEAGKEKASEENVEGESAKEEEVIEEQEQPPKDDQMDTQDAKPTNGYAQDKGVDKPNGVETIQNEDTSKMDETGAVDPADATANEGKDATSKPSDAVEQSPKREESTPSSILEKGLIYFFFRGRVGIHEPSDVNDIARSYIVLRPLPHGAKLGDGVVSDAGNNRLLALPKKVLPVSAKDRFMVFVDKANANIEEIKKDLSSSDYMTKTVGSRHTPAAAPIGEGVYAITTTGRESHLSYILTIPSELNEVQQEVGLKARGSFVTSVKNPQFPGPANTNLPKGPDYPQEILDEFRTLRWTALQPKFLDYANTQILLIGHSGEDLGKATEQQGNDEKHDKDTPLEEMEKLEHEDELRVEHLKGDDSVFEDLGLSSKEFPKVQTTW